MATVKRENRSGGGRGSRACFFCRGRKWHRSAVRIEGRGFGKSGSRWWLGGGIKEMGQNCGVGKVVAVGQGTRGGGCAQVANPNI